MPKGINLKSFGRRKSSGNALEFEDSAAPPPVQQPAGQSSFRVLERPDKKSANSYGGSSKVAERSFNSPLRTLRGKSADDLRLGPNSRSVDNSTRNRAGWPLTGARGSGGTTNSGSSGYYESSGASARHSSTSTLPSSLDQEHSPGHEELFQHPRKSQTTGMYQTVAGGVDEPPPPPPSFSSRAARAFSFGNKHARKNSQDIPPLPPPHTANGSSLNPSQSHSPYREPVREPYREPYRERGMTTSSYASTAVPTKAELTLSSPDFGNDDFGNMFDSLKKPQQPEPSPVGSFHRTDSEPMYPPRTHSRNALTPSPNPLKLNRDDSNSPYSWDDGSSNDGLVSNSALSSPNLPDIGPPGPAVGNGIAQAFLGSSKSGYSRVPERYTSPGPDERDSVESVNGLMTANHGKGKEPAYAYPNRQAHVEDEDRWTRKFELRDPQEQAPPKVTSASSNRLTPSNTSNSLDRPQQVNGGASRGGAASPISSAGDSFGDSNTTTPRAARNLSTMSENVMHDSSPLGPPSRATRPSVHQRTESGQMKKLTPAEYNRLAKMNAASAQDSDDEEEELSGDEYDDEDDLERARRMASQRQKQEANMSVYRQQMKKVTGGGPTDLPSSSASTVRPGMDRASSSAASLHLGGISGTPPEASARGKTDDDDDEDVPLGILQAHGFPSSSRPPTRQGAEELSHQRRTSVAGSAVVNGGAGQGNLPPFARRLPADPYFGAGLVNQSTRESLALNSSGASVVGMPPSQPPQIVQPQMQPMPQASPMGHPGGLVGVIAGEERARAMRRGNTHTAALGMGMGGSMPLPPNMQQMPPTMPPRTMSMGNLAPPQVYNPSGAPPMPMMPQMGMPGMMPHQPAPDANQQQMQQFMAMQMQLMQNMLMVQQAQMGTAGAQSPQPQPPQQQQQAGDYLGVNFGNMSINGQNRPMSMASQASNPQVYRPQSSGRSMTMMNPPTGWGSAANPSGPRPNSAMPLSGNGYAPSVHGLNISNGGQGNGYTPSIAPSERSNVGMPSRYRPVTQNGDTSRTQSMTSNLTLQAFTKQQTSPNLPGTPYNATSAQTPKQTIRIVDKPKGAPKVTSRQLEDDDDEGWMDMKKKRDDKKKSKWSLRKDKTTSSSTNEPGLGELYHSMD